MQSNEFDETQKDEIDDIQDAMNNFDEENERYQDSNTSEDNVKDSIDKEIEEMMNKVFDEKKFNFSSEENFSFEYCQNELKSTLDFTEQILYSQGFEKLRSAFSRLDDDMVIEQDLEKIAKDSVEKEKQIEELKAQKAKEDKEQRKDESYDNTEQDKGGLSLEKRIEILEKELRDLKIKELSLKEEKRENDKAFDRDIREFQEQLLSLDFHKAYKALMEMFSKILKNKRIKSQLAMNKEDRQKNLNAEERQMVQTIKRVFGGQNKDNMISIVKFMHKTGCSLKSDFDTMSKEKELYNALEKATNAFDINPTENNKNRVSAIVNYANENLKDFAKLFPKILEKADAIINPKTQEKTQNKGFSKTA